MRNHWTALALSLLVGSICGAPQLFSRSDSAYRGVQMFGADAEYDYVAKMNQARYDDYSKGLFPPDQGKSYYLAPMLAERSMGLAGDAVGLSAIEVNVAAKFLLPALLFLLLYGFFLELFCSRSVALLAPLFIILSPHLLDAGEIVRFFSFQTTIDTFLPYTRPISPQTSSLFLFVCMWGMYRLATRKTSLWFAGLLGLITGVSLYAYIYTWTFVCTFVAVYGVHFLVRRDWERLRLSVAALAVNAVVAVPFFINLIRARLDADYLDTAARIGLAPSHELMIGALLLIGYIFIFGLWPKNHLTDTKRYILFVFVALTIVLNQQVITGVKLQPGHFHWYTTKPFLICIVVFLILYWAKRMLHSRGELFSGAALVAGVLLGASMVQIHSYRANYQDFLADQRYAPVLSLLNTNYSERKTIWAEQNLSTLILAYTPHRAPDNLHSPYYTHGAQYLHDMLFLENRISHLSAKRIADFSVPGWEYIVGRIFGIDPRKQFADGALLQSELANLSSAYQDFRSVPLAEAFQRIGVDLIVVERGQSKVDFDSFSFLVKDGEANGFSVYRFQE